MTLGSPEKTLPPPSGDLEIEISVESLLAPRPAAPRRTRYWSFFILSGICLWACVRLYELRCGEPQSDEAGENAMSGEPPPPPLDLPPRSVSVDALRQVSVVLEDSSVARLGDVALEAGEVMVLNFWSPHCNPCIEELPAFRRLFDGARGGTAHFVPILVDDATPRQAARREYQEYGGPPPSVVVADAGLREELTGALGGAVTLPTTLVLDCDLQLRWSRFRRLEAEDFAELQSVLGALQGDLAAPRCVEARKRARAEQERKERELREKAEGTEPMEPIDPAPPLDARSKCVLDGICDVKRGESTMNCPADCKPKIRRQGQ